MADKDPPRAFRREHRRPLRAAPVERLTHSLGGGAESKLFTTGPLVIEVAAERMHLGPVGAWVEQHGPDHKNIMACRSNLIAPSSMDSKPWP